MSKKKKEQVENLGIVSEPMISQQRLQELLACDEEVKQPAVEMMDKFNTNQGFKESPQYLPAEFGMQMQP